MKKANFFVRLLGSNTGISSRRFIALLMLPAYIAGISIGIMSKNYNFYVTAMVAGAIPIFIAFFTLKWSNVSTIVSSIQNNKISDSTIESMDSNLNDEAFTRIEKDDFPK